METRTELYSKFEEITEEGIRIGKKIGFGSFGSVYEVISPSMGLIAGKKMKPNQIENEVWFLNELRIISSLNRPNIIRFFAYSMINNEKYILMEYAKNKSLYNAFSDQEKYFNEFKWPIRYDICVGICRGMIGVHNKGILHRDLNSHNILLDGFIPKIADFGLSAKKNHIDEATSVDDQCNVWLAPEVENGQYTEKSDIYSMGIVFWEICTGKIPRIETENVNENNFLNGISENTSSDFIQIIRECLDSNPEKRPSAQQILERLEKIAEQNTLDINIERSIFKAASLGDLESIKAIISKGTSINEKYQVISHEGWGGMQDASPLHFAAKNGHLNIVEYLVNNKADMNIVDKNNHVILIK